MLQTPIHQWMSGDSLFSPISCGGIRFLLACYHLVAHLESRSTFLVIYQQSLSMRGYYHDGNQRAICPTCRPTYAAGSLSGNRKGIWCPDLSPVGRLEQEGGVLAWPAHCPTEGAGNKVERANLLEACTGRKLCPLLPAVAGSIEAHSIGCPSMLLIHKVYRG